MAICGVAASDRLTQVQDREESKSWLGAMSGPKRSPALLSVRRPSPASRRCNIKRIYGTCGRAMRLGDRTVRSRTSPLRPATKAWPSSRGNTPANSACRPNKSGHCWLPSGVRKDTGQCSLSDPASRKRGDEAAPADGRSETAQRQLRAVLAGQCFFLREVVAASAKVGFVRNAAILASFCCLSGERQLWGG